MAAKTTGVEQRAILLPVLVYATLASAIVSSLGMLLVPTISEQFGVAVSTAQWMLTVNLLVGAVATPIMGRLSDGPHKKRLLLWTLLVILLGSAVAAAAPNFTIFLIGRALQGLAYGMVPVTISLARRYLRPDSVQHGISSLSVVVSTGLGLGYPLTGILSEISGFRSAFGFAAVFMASAIIVVWRVVPAGPDDQAPTTRFDVPGSLLLAVGLSALLLAVGEGPNWGWTSMSVIAILATAFLVLIGWVRVELRSDHPLVNLRVFRNGDVVLANATAIGLGAAMYVTLSIVSLLAQAPLSSEYGLALAVIWAGFVFLPLSAGSLGANRMVRAASRRVNMATLLLIGAAVVALAAFGLWLAHSSLGVVLAGMLVFGVGIGMTFAAMPALIASNVAAEELGSAVSFNQVLRTVGGSFGSALSGAVLAAHLDLNHVPTGQAVDLSFALGAFGCGGVLIALAVKLGEGRLRRRRQKT